ncbi:response regulator [Catenulispora rubra]|uniref:response regulator n=1 Tax=Catenulispora rubra TaxID=280293 RepID=UPI001892721F|nr:response regulator transcription factor [Catenulispora rubra]
MSAIRVVVVDDQALVRVGFCGIVDAADGFEVVGQAASGAEAVDVARRELPDVVLMDIRMPGMDGLEATRQIVAAGRARVLILTTFDLDDYIYRALRAGASGFLLKDTPPEDLLAAVRVIASGEALLAPSVTRRLIAEFAARPEPGQVAEAAGAERDRVIGLMTDREREVLTLITQGMTNAEIAERLYVSTGTVKTHIGHLLAKLDARDRVQLVILAYKAGLA